MSVDHLVQMANDIGHFFATQAQREDAIEGIRAHIRTFWDPRMRRQILAHLQQGGEGLDDLPRAAVARLAQTPALAAAAGAGVT